MCSSALEQGLCVHTEQPLTVPDPPAGHHHKNLTLPAQAVLQQPRQLAVAVGDVSSLLLQRLQDMQSASTSEALHGVITTKMRPWPGAELVRCQGSQDL